MQGYSSSVPEKLLRDMIKEGEKRELEKSVAFAENLT